MKSLLREGLAPEQVALTICLGSAVGTVPVLGVTTLLCVGLAALFRLNQAAMQAVNYLVYPLQLALFVPFFRLGSRWLRWGPPLSMETVTKMLHGDLCGSTAAFVWGTGRALVAWLLIVPPLALLLYPLLVVIFRRRARLFRNYNQREG